MNALKGLRSLNAFFPENAATAMHFPTLKRRVRTHLFFKVTNQQFDFNTLLGSHRSGQIDRRTLIARQKSAGSLL